MKRRYFLKSITAGAALSSLSMVACKSESEPVQNISWAMGWLLWRDFEGRDFKIMEALQDLKDFGADGIEFTPRTNELADQGYSLVSFKQMLQETGLRVSGHYFSAPFHEISQKREIVRGMQDKIQSLARLGGKNIIIGPPGVDDNVNRPEAIRQMAEMLNDLGRIALDQGVEIGIHPHLNTLVETPDEVHLVMSETDPEQVFFSPDTGHLYLGGADVLETLKRYSSRINYFHFKDAAGSFKRPDFFPNMRETGRGDIDFPAIMRFLKEIGYQGWINIEQDHTQTTPDDSASVSMNYVKEKLKPIYS